MSSINDKLAICLHQNCQSFTIRHRFLAASFLLNHSPLFTRSSYLEGSQSCNNKRCRHQKLFEEHYRLKICSHQTIMSFIKWTKTGFKPQRGGLVVFAAVKSIQMINNLSSLFIQPSSVESCQNDLFFDSSLFFIVRDNYRDYLLPWTMFCSHKYFTHFFTATVNLQSQFDPSDDEAPRINWT